MMCAQQVQGSVRESPFLSLLCTSTALGLGPNAAVVGGGAGGALET